MQSGDVEDLRPGDPDRLGAYEVTGRLGEGGQGVVYLGRAENDQIVAIKLLHADLTENEEARQRFVRELDVAKQVASFCTAQVLDADVAGDRPYIVSEYVPGPSLNRQVREEGPLTGGALERLAVGTATALVAIHQAGVLHRDFKPHNVLLGPDGPRVIDFGVARALSGATSVTSRVIGTPAYMAPEQMRGDSLTPAVDVFCWAGVMIYAATGRPPFGQDTIPAVINRILHEPPDMGDMAGGLAAVLRDCLAKDPADRPQAREVLMRLLGDESAAAAAPAPMPPEAAATAVSPDAGMAPVPPVAEASPGRSTHDTLPSGPPIPPAGDVPERSPAGADGSHRRRTLGVIAGALALLIAAGAAAIVLALARGGDSGGGPGYTGTQPAEVASSSSPSPPGPSSRPTGKRSSTFSRTPTPTRRSTVPTATVTTTRTHPATSTPTSASGAPTPEGAASRTATSEPSGVASP